MPAPLPGSLRNGPPAVALRCSILQATRLPAGPLLSVAVQRGARRVLAGGAIRRDAPGPVVRLVSPVVSPLPEATYKSLLRDGSSLYSMIPVLSLPLHYSTGKSPMTAFPARDQPHPIRKGKKTTTTPPPFVTLANLPNLRQYTKFANAHIMNSASVSDWSIGDDPSYPHIGVFGSWFPGFSFWLSCSQQVLGTPRTVLPAGTPIPRSDVMRRRGRGGSVRWN